MAQNYGFHPLNQEPFGIFNQDHPIFVSCCGFDEFIQQFFYQSRPKGRSDYYFLYVAEGYLLVHLDEVITLKKGECILIPPHQQHAIQYPSLKQAKVYWVHFSGHEAQDYYHVFQSTALPMDRSNMYLLDEMIKELQYQDLDYEKLTAQYFIQLLIQLKRQTSTSKKDPVIQDLVLYMHMNLKKIHSINDMANYVSLSSSRLSHRFQQVMTISPMNYLIQLRMHTAHRLLLSTDLSIKEIADQVGYNNSLYFSSQFKKHYKLSPSEHRHHYRYD